jgi:uncharacterized protein with HEPN domain
MYRKKREVEVFVFDILVAILKIEDTSRNFRNCDDLIRDYRAWDSVIREFEIIGEASKHLIRSNLLSTEYQIVVDFRNKIIHEYFGIDKEEVWDIIRTDLKDFKKTILKLIRNIDKNLKSELIDCFVEDNKHLNFIVNFLESLKN